MIRSFKTHQPRIASSAFVAETATIIGRVTLDEQSSVWYGAVLRGDECAITVGKGSNIQDNAVLHGNSAIGADVVIGEYVTVGHGAIIHGCRIGDETLIGMGATVLNGAVIGKRCVIGAGALIKENAVIPDGSLVVGVPGRIVRALSSEQAEGNRRLAEEYIALAEEY